MQIEVKLPQLTEDEAEATVDEVSVSAGDIVQKDDVLVLVTAGKASGLDVRSPSTGKVAGVSVSPGDTLAVGDLIATIEAEEGAAEPAPAAADPAPAATAQPAEPEPAPQSAAQPAAQPMTPPAQPQQAPPTQQPQPASAAPQPASQPPSQPAEKQAPPAAATSTVAAGPAIRRFAREVGVDLSRVVGSGPNGRITRDDVLQVVRASSQANGKSNAATGVERDKFGPVRNEPLSGVRRTIANQMLKSWSTVPRVTNFDDADVTELERMRQSSKGDYAEKDIKLTTMPFLIKAVAMSLRDHPSINATVDVENSQVSYKGYVNIGVAVDTDSGLVVPNLANADDKSISEIARELSEVASKVRDNDFASISMKGSTFTISNLGAIGGTYSTPIVNIPEVAILLVGRSRKLPVVVNDEVVVRLMMPLSLSYDHRLVDGGAAARFLNEVIGYLEAPSRLLLAP